MPTSDEEARLTQALADLLHRAGANGLRDYYPRVASGAIYKISIELWQNPPERRDTGTLTAWDKK